MAEKELKCVALVTGASSGIGREIAGLLLERGFDVYGVGRTFDAEDFSDDGIFKNHRGKFTPVTADLAAPYGGKILAEDLKEMCRRKKQTLKILVNCAGIAYYGLHESLDAVKIHEMVAVNAEAPMVLANEFLRELRENKGIIVNVSSVTAKSHANTHGCAYGATKAALTSFGNSLFEEVRKHGVRVCNIHPDLTETGLYRNADFTVSGEKMSCLFAKEVAEAAIYCIEARDGMAVTDVTVRPSVNKIVKKQ
jgi:short-subunit dehydrogenase